MIAGEQAPGGAVPSGASAPAPARDDAARARRGSWLVIAGRVLLLLSAGFALVSGFALARARERATIGSLELWVCPMDPEVQSRAPGECPICHMALERSQRGGRAASYPGARHGSLESVEIRLFADGVHAPAWAGSDGTIMAALYRDDLLRLAPGERGTFFRSAAPAAGLGVRLAAGPPLPWDDSTSVARFRPDPGTGRGAARTTAPLPALPSGEVGWIELNPPPRELLVVPWSAVLHSADGPYVLVPAKEDGLAFSKRPVEVGRTLYGRAVEGRLPPESIVVLSGLRADERVVAGDTFVSDAERRLWGARKQAEGLSP